jgi:hypothetical protein
LVIDWETKARTRSSVAVRTALNDLAAFIHLTER